MRGADRDAIRARLDEVAARREDGLLLPEDVVADAADPSSPLHGEFEWDDRVAGHAHRIERARVVIRVIRPAAQWQIVESGTAVPIRVKVCQPPDWVRDPGRKPKEAGYARLASMGEGKDEDEGRASQVLGNELDAIEGRVRRAEAIAVALGREGMFLPLLDACGLLREDL